MIVNYFFVMVEFTVHFCHEQLSNILFVIAGFIRLLAGICARTTLMREDIKDTSKVKKLRFYFTTMQS